MDKNKTLKPAISVNLKKPVIRIHKDTLHSIGDPEYILLLVNPKECALAVLPSHRSDPKAQHISKSSLTNKKSFELYSTSLVNNLRNLCKHWEDNNAYRIYGEIIPDKAVIRFNMAESISINE
ncbi:MAG: hypothetical protein UR30_C0019G0003 [Candidatus Peregrinibacteria bacterium GW2011_GWC2_33_13]|nr:MAG: hypothetical protein UR30_C0019G0003 [Candidatus Peregrinibacteria bacterium GW2011_GWC2_33_13]